jgi:hypothetical protein
MEVITMGERILNKTKNQKKPKADKVVLDPTSTLKKKVKKPKKTY